jgi:hypothetical protein
MLLEFLEKRSIRPGALIHLASRNYDQTLSITTGSGSVPLGSAAAEKVWVSPAKSPSPSKSTRRPRP